MKKYLVMQGTVRVGECDHYEAAVFLVAMLRTAYHQTFRIQPCVIAR
jgi:hypothetical protein